MLYNNTEDSTTLSVDDIEKLNRQHEFGESISLDNNDNTHLLEEIALLKDEINNSALNESLNRLRARERLNNMDEVVVKNSDLYAIASTNKSRLSVLGMGYVGVVSAACFSDMGHRVVGVDPDKNKLEVLNKGESPIVEEGLSELIKKVRDNNKFTVTSDTVSAVINTDVTLVSVGTPSDERGACDLVYLKVACEQIGHGMGLKNDYHVIVFRSTIPPRTTRSELIPILEKCSGKICGVDFGVCFNPEFLRESTAIDDFFDPPKTVIGAFDERSGDIAKKLYKDIHAELTVTSLEVAEFVKYIDNTWHALKVTFGNEVGRICKAVDVDSHDVMDIFLQDTKLNISPYYLKPGFAFGGSCLPKDTRGIKHLADSLNVNVPVIDHINESNEWHINHAVRLIADTADGKSVGIVGITFKAGTDDLRESPTITLIKKLMLMDYRVFFYDPCVTEDKVFDEDDEVNKKMNMGRCREMNELMSCSDTMVVTHRQPYVNSLAEGQHNIIDLVRMSEKLANGEKYQGVCW